MAIRVSKGGHNISADVIERRYYKGLKNFVTYISLADSWYVYDNSGSSYEMVAKRAGGAENIINLEVLEKIIGNE